MTKAFTWIVVVLVALAALGFGGRAYANRLMDTRALATKTLGPATPANVGVPFSRVAVEAGDRTLIGWWVRARADSGRIAPALLFLHGNRSAISDYVELQRFLYRQGVSSLVFDYSGFGASGGAPSLSNAVADAGAVARAFSDSAGADARKVAMGSALGATVLLQAIDSVQPHVSGVVIEGVDASVKESAIRGGRIPKLVAPLVREIGDNVAAASRVRVPLLAVHSYADNRVPFDDAQRVVSAVSARSSLVRHWRRGHSALLASTRPCDWAPVLAFVKEGVLPVAKLDSTNACDAEAERLAAAKAAADSAKAKADSMAAARAAAAAKAPTKAPATKAPATKARTAPPPRPQSKTQSKTPTKTVSPTKRPTSTR
jgi:uncharacterized protein